MINQKILVVDDEPEAVELLESKFKQARHKVVTAANGDEAFKKAKAAQPALVGLVFGVDGDVTMLFSPRESVLRVRKIPSCFDPSRT